MFCLRLEDPIHCCTIAAANPVAESDPARGHDVAPKDPRAGVPAVDPAGCRITSEPDLSVDRSEQAAGEDTPR